MRIRGVVIDEQAERIARARITASRGEGDPCLITHTDRDGRFAFDLDPDDEDFTHIHARAGRRSGSISLRDDTPGGTSLTLHIAPTVALHGRVIDHEGRPVHGAMVATCAETRTTTDASGGYRLDGLRPGKVHLHAWRNGLQLQTATVLAGQVTHLDWTLPAATGRSIRFTLTEDTPADVRPAWSLSIHHPIQLHLEGTLSDAREVTLHGLPTDHMLQGGVWSNGLHADPCNHYLAANPRKGLIEWSTRLAPARRAEVAGIVVDEHGQPLPAIEVALSGTALANEVTCWTDARGRFSCEFEQRLDESLLDTISFSLVDKQRVMNDRDGPAWPNPRSRCHAVRQLPVEGELVLRTVRSAGVRGRAVARDEAISGALVTLHVTWGEEGSERAACFAPRTQTRTVASRSTGSTQRSETACSCACRLRGWRAGRIRSRSATDR